MGRADITLRKRILIQFFVWRGPATRNLEKAMHRNASTAIIVAWLCLSCTGYRTIFDLPQTSKAASKVYNCPTAPASAFSTFTWQPMTITGQPSGALNPNEARGAFDYVPALDKIFYWTQDATTNALWIFDMTTNTWSQPSTALPTCSRVFSTKVNPLNDHILIFCGTNSSNLFTDQVLDFDPVGLQFSVLSTGGIATRFGAAVAWDCKRKQYLVFGGCNNATLCNVPQTLQDTWSFDPTSANWTNLAPSGTPSVRNQAILDYDVANDRYVMYGGVTGNGGTLRSDTCVYDPSSNAWSCSTPANSPSCAGYENSFIWIPPLDRILHFAGKTASASCNDLSAFSVSGNSYSVLTQANQPAPRGYHGTVFDSNRNRLVIYGGRNHVGGTFFDMYELDF